MNKIFIFEGLPGAGKTSLVRDLAKDLGLVRIGEIIGPNYLEMSPEIAKGKGHNFFTKSDKRKYFLARKSQKNNSVLVDRCFLSTIIYNICSQDHQKKKISLAQKHILLRKLMDEDIIHIFIKISPELSQRRKPKKRSIDDIWSYKKYLTKTERFYEDTLLNKENFKIVLIEGDEKYSKVYKRVRRKIINLIHQGP